MSSMIQPVVYSFSLALRSSRPLLRGTTSYLPPLVNVGLKHGFRNTPLAVSKRFASTAVTFNYGDNSQSRHVGSPDFSYGGYLVGMHFPKLEDLQVQQFLIPTRDDFAFRRMMSLYPKVSFNDRGQLFDPYSFEMCDTTTYSRSMLLAEDLDRLTAEGLSQRYLIKVCPTVIALREEASAFVNAFVGEGAHVPKVKTFDNLESDDSRFVLRRFYSSPFSITREDDLLDVVSDTSFLDSIPPETLAKLFFIQFMFGDSDQNNPTNLLIASSALTDKKLLTFDFGRWFCDFQDEKYRSEVSRVTGVDFTDKDLDICSIPWCRDRWKGQMESSEYVGVFFRNSVNPFILLLKAQQEKGVYPADLDLTTIKIPQPVIDNIVVSRKQVEGLLKLSGIYSKERLASGNLPFQHYYNMLQIKQSLPDGHPHKALTLKEIITGVYNIGYSHDETLSCLEQAQKGELKPWVPTLDYLEWLSGKGG